MHAFVHRQPNVGLRAVPDAKLIVHVGDGGSTFWCHSNDSTVVRASSAVSTPRTMIAYSRLKSRQSVAAMLLLGVLLS